MEFPIIVTVCVVSAACLAPPTFAGLQCGSEPELPLACRMLDVMIINWGRWNVWQTVQDG